MMEKNCYHCGDEVIGKGIVFDQKSFCCNGCKSVYQLLKDTNLGNFYTMESNAGAKPSLSNQHKYAFLEVETIREKFIDFQDDKSARATLFLPQIHCSSCIYLLENLTKIEPAILSCQVNFAKREAAIIFDPKKITLAELALLLDRIGYAPNFGNRSATEKKIDTQFLYKLGIAGFAFGSIMLWSFPEYLGVKTDDPAIRNFTSYLSFAISIPVLFYSASEYFISAFKALRYKSLNLDVPITIGIIALYLQSAYSILIGDGPGYMDSFAGFIFFLLIGKWFQNKTYKTLSFERDYTSYFPVAVTRLVPFETGEKEEIIEIEALKEQDKIVIRNEEIIPCDSTLLSDTAKIDYSFVTGESNPIHKQKGDFIYAGGKLLGQRIALKVEKESNRSHLTQIWNDIKTTKKKASGFLYQNKLSVYFLTIILIIASISAIAWTFIDVSRVTQIIVAILIVACPCALALSAPFTFGNVMRLLGRKGLYLKNTAVIEQLNSVTDIVFDKTGTLTTGVTHHVEYSGDALSLEQTEALYCLANSSTHPLSRAIVQYLRSKKIDANFPIDAFTELSGKGISGNINSFAIRIGNAEITHQKERDATETSTFIFIQNGEEITKGKFVFTSELRDGIAVLLRNLSKYNLHVLSGDRDKDRVLLEQIFPKNSTLLFEQTPKDKLNYIDGLKQAGKHVLMVGDGLNDAGALGIADVGIAVSEDVFRFTPSSDAIIEATKLWQLDKLLLLSNFSKTVLKVCLAFSVAYNIIGLSFAISGNLTPLIAAILMPISSITVVFISTFLVYLKK
jgi:Cu+-exporting ATPase